VIGLAGKIPLIPDKQLEKYFDVLLSIGNEPADLFTALQSTAANLRRTATAVGNMLSLGRS
jgi:glycerate kinase